MANRQRNNKYSYNTIPNLNADWGDDPTNGHKQFAGEMVQDFIKRQITRLDNTDAETAKKAPSAFHGFVDDVRISETGSKLTEYDKIVYDRTKKAFLALKVEDDVEKYFSNFDRFEEYNNGEFPNARPYQGKMYAYGVEVYMYNGSFVSITQNVAPDAEASEADVVAIVTDYVPE